jgi:hypothetical protein
VIKFGGYEMFKLIAASMIVLLLSACANVTKIMSESAFLGHQIESGDVFKNIKGVELSNTEIQIVNHAQNKVDQFRVKWKSVIANPKSIADLDQGMLGDYADLRGSYAEVDAVVRRNWNKYDQQSKNALLAVQDHATRLDQSVDKYVAAKNKEKVAIQVLRYASVLASFAMGMMK